MTPTERDAMLAELQMLRVTRVLLAKRIIAMRGVIDDLERERTELTNQIFSLATEVYA